MAAPDNPVPDPARGPVAVAPPAPAPIAAPAVASRFGEISPAFAARVGASIDAGLALGARNAAAREFSIGQHRPRGSRQNAALPGEIATPQALPRSRVRAALVSGPSGSPTRVR
jgi:hypothetical protein